MLVGRVAMAFVPFNDWRLSVVIRCIARGYLLVWIIDMTSAFSSSTSSAYVDPKWEATLER